MFIPLPRWRRLAVLLAAVVVALIPTAGAVAAPEDKPTTLRVAMLQEIGSLNPFLGFFASDAEIFRLVYDSLIKFRAQDYQTVPGLAESWEVADDGVTWTFAIRTDATWSDGEKVTAEDVAFTYNLMMEDSDAATANGSFVSNFESVSAPNDETLVIKTKTPDATVLSNETPIVPEHVWSDIAVGDFANDDFPIVGSGPFILTEFKTNQFIRLKANKDYWGAKPKVDELVFRFFKNSDAAVQALRKGEIDLVGDMTPQQFEALRGEKNIALHKARNRRFVELTFNPGAQTRGGQLIGDGHPALQDARVRQAIHHAIDLDTVVKKVMNGYAEKAGGYIPAVFSRYYWEPDPQTEVTFNLDKANRILDEAGYKKGADGIRIMPEGGKKLKFRLYGHSDRTFETPLADFVTEWLEDIGIAVEVQQMTSTRLNDLIGDGIFDMAFSGWGVNPDPDFILSIQTCANLPDENGEGGNTDTFYCNQEYDKLYKKQRSTTDEAERVKIVHQMQEILYTEVPIITLFYQNVLEGSRSDRFTGFQRQPKGGVTTKQQGHWGFVSATPVDKAASGESSSGAATIGVGVAAVALLALVGGFLLIRRRNATADDRE